MSDFKNRFEGLRSSGSAPRGGGNNVSSRKSGRTKDRRKNDSEREEKQYSPYDALWDTIGPSILPEPEPEEEPKREPVKQLTPVNRQQAQTPPSPQPGPKPEMEQTTQPQPEPAKPVTSTTTKPTSSYESFMDDESQWEDGVVEQPETPEEAASMPRTALDDYLSEQEALRQANEAQKENRRKELERELADIQANEGYITDPDEANRVAARKKEIADELESLTPKEPELVNWEGRDALIAELNEIDTNSGLISTPEEANAAAARRAEIIRQLEAGDEAAGNGLQSYDAADRGRQIITGATGQYAAGVTNALGTAIDAMGAIGERYGNASPYAGYATDEQSAASIGTGTDEEKQAWAEEMAGVRGFGSEIEQVADLLGEGAARDLTSAKSGLSGLGSAGVDIATNVIQMGYDMALGRVPGMSTLGAMFLRSAGGASQEARQAGADVLDQVAYGAVKGGIEVATERLFDGVAGIYGKGAADEVVEGLIRHLSDTPTGMTVLRVLASAVEEGGEEVIADIFDPLAKTIINDETLYSLFFDEEGRPLKGSYALNGSEVLYDFLIGAAIGGMGAGGSIATGQDAVKNAEAMASVGRSTDSGSEVTTPGGKAITLTPDAALAEAAAPTEVAGIPAPDTSGEVTPLMETLAEATGTAPAAPVGETRMSGIDRAEAAGPEVAERAATMREGAKTLRATADSLEAAAATDPTVAEMRQGFLNQADRMDAEAARLEAEAATVGETRMSGIDRAEESGPEAPAPVSEPMTASEKLRQREAEMMALTNASLEGRAAAPAEETIPAETVARAEAAADAVLGPDADPAEKAELAETIAMVLNEDAEKETAEEPTETRPLTANEKLRQREADVLGKPKKTVEDDVRAAAEEQGVAGNEYAIQQALAYLNGTANTIGSTAASLVDAVMAAAQAGTTAAETASEATETADNLGEQVRQAAADAGIVATDAEVQQAINYMEGRTNEITGKVAQIVDAASEASKKAQDAAEAETPSTTPQALPTQPREFNSPQTQSQQPGAQNAPPSTVRANGPTVERGFNENVRTSQTTDAALAQSLGEEKALYQQLVNKDVLAKAQSIYETGVLNAKSYVDTALDKAKNGMKLAPEVVPLARMVANELSRSGDVTAAQQMIADVAAELTAAGQLGQVGKILRNTDPMTVEQTIQKMIDTINRDYSKTHHFGRAANWRAGLTDAELDMIRSTDFTRDGAFEETWTKIAKRLGQEMPATFREKLHEYRRINMLLRPRTQIKNYLSNAPMKYMRKGAETLSGAIQSALVKAGVMDKSQQTRTAFVGKQSRSLAQEYFDNNKDTILSEGNKFDMNKVLRNYRTYFKDGAIAKAASKLTGKDLHNFMETARRATYKMLEMGDAPFVKSAFIDNLAQYCQAQGITTAEGITQDAIDFAMANAMEATFKAENVVANTINNLKKVPGVGDLIDIVFPFTTTPANITSLMLKYSPVGYITTIAEGLRGADINTVVDSASKATVGSAIFALGILLRSLGYITGAPDDDEGKAAFDKANGISPYSILGRWSYDWIQPVGSLLALGAEMDDSLSGSDESLLTALINAMYASGDSVLDMSLFQNISTILSANGNKTENLVKGLVEGAGTQLVPGLLQDVNKILDPTVRSTYTGGNVIDNTLAKMMAGIPGLSEKLPARVNVMGEDMTRGELGWRIIDALLNPGVTNYNQTSETAQKIYDLYEATGDKSVFPNIAPYKIKDATLSGEERAEYQRTMGQSYMDNLDALFGDVLWDRTSTTGQLYAANRLKEYSGDEAKREYAHDHGTAYSSDWDDERKIADAGVELGPYLLAKKQYNADGKGALKMDELYEWLIHSDYSDSQRALIWSSNTTSKKTWKEYLKSRKK